VEPIFPPQWQFGIANRCARGVRPIVRSARKRNGCPSRLPGVEPLRINKHSSAITLSVYFPFLGLAFLSCKLTVDTRLGFFPFRSVNS
jgi:hypothetical protein